MAEEGRKWQGGTDGTSWMHRALIGMMKVVPLWLMYFFMHLAIPVYMVVNHKAYLANYHYFRKRHGYGPLKAFFHVWLNHVTFGGVIIDRFGAFAGKKFRVEVPEIPVYEELCSRQEGFLQVSSHIGSDEMAGYVLRAGKPINEDSDREQEQDARSQQYQAHSNFRRYVASRCAEQCPG